jgi:hypothetical protein
MLICTSTLASKFFSSLAYILESLSGTWKTLSMTNNKWRQCGPRPQLQVWEHIFTSNEITLKKDTQKTMMKIGTDS